VKRVAVERVAASHADACGKHFVDFVVRKLFVRTDFFLDKLFG
jgi:hypothetical protein